ncbi:hypothetical protein Y032_0142g2347 [Ancylostoma ceylanicum]|uniref:Uncharacterized protein n=1 Tax=Ancylostoma ceylanicum TaxID=53326 RepID=A0A016T2T1_9BILA|nr:hypothetical protein Y032_0142g2347 [Ancylostoma ceylanicum]
MVCVCANMGLHHPCLSHVQWRPMILASQNTACRLCRATPPILTHSWCGTAELTGGILWCKDDRPPL